MNEEKIQRIVEGLRKVPELDYGIYQIVVTNKNPQKISIIPLSGRITKVVIDNKISESLSHCNTSY
jgi:hypothetical protein